MAKEFEVRATFNVTFDGIVEAESPEGAEAVTREYLGNECNFVVERFDDFCCKELQFTDIEVEDVNEKC